MRIWEQNHPKNTPGSGTGPYQWNAWCSVSPAVV
jgi:hypothetical protein